MQKLFSKCGLLISARFDTNEFGQFLGTATVIYAKASAAARAIKDYNMSQIDKRTMRVEFAAALQPAKPVDMPHNSGQQASAPKKAGSVRRTENRIGKSGRGRTLNVSGRRR